MGRYLLDLGVVSAGDMTTEAIVTKLAYLFGRGLSVAAVRLRSEIKNEVKSE